MNICHITSVHSRYDDRIFIKECKSLSEAGEQVSLVVHDRQDDEQIDGVSIFSTGEEYTSRLKRVLIGNKKLLKKVQEIQADVCQLHDPELLLLAKKLKRMGKKVIFDSHEDVPAQILDKEWIPIPIRRAVSKVYKMYETNVVRQIDAVIGATPHITEQFVGRARKAAVINNYPKLDDIMFHDTPFEQREPVICYAGGIGEQRGERIMVEAVKDLDATLILAGEHEKMRKNNIVYAGMLDREGINRLYSRAVAGMVMLLPTKNYINSLPIKMFEYMAAGLPVIASNFPLWEKIITENKCGICVDPEDIKGVSKACQKLVDNPQLGQQMGLAGYKTVREKYNWKIEEKKLLDLYRSLD